MRMSIDEAIKVLEEHHMWTGEPQEVVDVRLENAALEYAISSLKTDEAYQIMYEGGEIYSKDEVIALLIKIRTRINNMYLDIDSMECIKDVIEEEINVLRGEKDGKRIC